MKTISLLISAALFSSAATAFSVSKTTSSLSTKVATGPLFMAPKGFDKNKPEPKQKSEEQIKREQQSSKYDEISGTGGQEYAIFVRQFGGEDKSWLPCGSVAVPRGAQVADAIFANEDALKKSIVRTFPRLKGFELEFEYGYNLKVYPDDPVEVAMKGGPKPQGLSIGNWISTLLSPVDASGTAPPTPPKN